MFGEEIKAIRKAKELKQQDLATAIGISRSYMAMIESGEREVTLTILKSLSKVLEVPIDALLLLSLDESEIAQEKKEMYTTMQPLIAGLIRGLYASK